jgi:hypothetical protein
MPGCACLCLAVPGCAWLCLAVFLSLSLSVPVSVFVTLCVYGFAKLLLIDSFNVVML